jgi:peptide deformylase
MRATMEAAPGVGLAAPQVGVPGQLAVLHYSPERWGQLTEDERTARERRRTRRPGPRLHLRRHPLESVVQRC